MAVASKVDICNMALDHFGKPTITSLTEGSAEAQACVRQYDIARRACLVRSPWTFARAIQKMPKMATNALADRWQFCYDMPNDALKIAQVLAPTERPRRDRAPRPMFIQNRLLYTDVPEASVFYIYSSERTLDWSTLFDEAVALALATRLAPTMTRRNSDRKTLQDMAREMLNEAIEADAQQEHERYTMYRDGYVDARDSSATYGRPQADGSTIWGN